MYVCMYVCIYVFLLYIKVEFCDGLFTDEVNEVMIKSSWSGMLAALSLLLNAWYLTVLTEVSAVSVFLLQWR